MTPRQALAALLATQDLGFYSISSTTPYSTCDEAVWTFASDSRDGSGISNATKAFRLIQSIQCDLQAAAILDVQHYGTEVHVFFAA